MWEDWHIYKYAELAIRYSYLQCSYSCTDNFYWITLMLNETLKHDNSQASSAVRRGYFILCFIHHIHWD